MVEVDTIRKRLDHVESIVETAEEHSGDAAESQALLKALGLLEQVALDLEQLSD